MRIANNLPALAAFTSLNKINRSLDKTIKALSTGLRINSSSDDAAGFAISEKMRSQISGLDVAIRNSQDGISLLQTAEGALGETNSMLQRMRELAVQASNDSLTSNDRQYLQLEIDELKKQIDRIADTTQFNKKRILDGSSGAVWSSSDTNVKAGEIYFSGDEDFVNALGLNTIQESKEAEFTASVYDAHTGTAVATNVKSSAPEFKGLISPEIDIEVDYMAGLSAKWDETTKRFITARKDVYTAMLHLKDNGTVFQVGSNEGV